MRSSSKYSFEAHSKGCLTGYYAGIAAVGLMAGVFGPTLSGLSVMTHTTLQGISTIFIAFPIGYMSGSLLTGLLLDRLPGHPVLTVSAVLCALTLFLTPFMASLTALVLVMGLMGSVQAGLDVGVNTLLGWVYGDKVGPYMNALHFFFGVGAIASPLVTAQTLKMTGGIAWTYWVLAALFLPVAAWLARLPSPPTIHSSEKTKAVRTDRVLLTLFILFFVFYCGLELGFGNWVCNYAKATRLEDEIHAAYLNSLFWGALTLGRLIGIPVAARVGPVMILAVDIAGCALSMGAVALWPGSDWVLWAGTAGAGLSMASIFATLMTFAGRGLKMTGLITSLVFIGSSLGAMIFPWLVGQWFEPVGPQVLIHVSLGLIVAMAAVLFGLTVVAPKASKKLGKGVTA